jgi:hypothetical protein
MVIEGCNMIEHCRIANKLREAITFSYNAVLFTWIQTFMLLPKSRLARLPTYMAVSFPQTDNYNLVYIYPRSFI